MVSSNLIRVCHNQYRIREGSEAPEAKAQRTVSAHCL
jgi:hypothetical protein